MSSTDLASADGVDRLPKKSKPAIVSDELGRISALVLGACPEETRVSFLFDGKLHIVVDVRSIEDVMAVEMTLPALGAGMFHDVQRGQAPRHGFGHRVTALVDR